MNSLETSIGVVNGWAEGSVRPRAAADCTRAVLCHPDPNLVEAEYAASIDIEAGGVQFRIAVGRNHDGVYRVWASVGDKEFVSMVAMNQGNGPRRKLFATWLNAAGVEDGDITEANGEVIESRHLTMVRQMEAAFQAELRNSKIRHAKRALHVVEAVEGDTGLDVQSSAELGERSGVAYIVPGFLPECQMHGVFAPRKGGKTHFLVDLHVSVGNDGQLFLGRSPVAIPKRCLLISPESGGGLLPEVVEKVAKSKGIHDWRRMHNCEWSTACPRIAEPRFQDLLGERIRRENLGLVSLDSIFRMIDGSQAANLFYIGRILGDIDEVCRSEDCTFVFSHHTLKHRGFRPGTLDDAAWAGFAEAVRSWAFISERCAYRPGSGLHHVFLSYGGTAGHSGLLKLDIDVGTRADPRWKVSVIGDDSSEASEATTQSSGGSDLVRIHADRLLACIKRHRAGETKTGLRAEAKLTAPDFQAAMSHLLEKGAVEQTKIRKRNGEHDAFRVSGLAKKSKPERCRKNARKNRRGGLSE